MSAVYEAEHLKLKRSFALKSLLPSLANNQEALTRFEREAEMLAGLRHPNVVEISDWETLPDGSPCMILEFLHGANLSIRISRGAMPWDAIARIGDQVMSALVLAHRNGITHRDLKPANIFIAIDDVGDERIKLLDFGVSKLRGVGTMTGMFAMLGTPSYMSPEQVSGNSEAVGPSTDVWAMAAILFEMATGRLAFQGDTFAATVMQITTGRPDPILAFRPDASPAFIDLVDRALSLDPARRIHTIDELRAGLRAALEPKNAYRLNTPVAGIPRIPMALQPRAPSPRPTAASASQSVSVALARGDQLTISRRTVWIASTVALLVTIGSLAFALAT
ncbi:MAG: serine/threonine protein kinase [Myxococcales bacterium]|nr:serine/threonine protein kinase [Myxococcales bacterium]